MGLKDRILFWRKGSSPDPADRVDEVIPVGDASTQEKAAWLTKILSARNISSESGTMSIYDQLVVDTYKRAPDFFLEGQRPDLEATKAIVDKAILAYALDTNWNEAVSKIYRQSNDNKVQEFCKKVIDHRFIKAAIEEAAIKAVDEKTATPEGSFAGMITYPPLELFQRPRPLAEMERNKRSAWFRNYMKTNNLPGQNFSFYEGLVIETLNTVILPNLALHEHGREVAEDLVTSALNACTDDRTWKGRVCVAHTARDMMGLCTRTIMPKIKQLAKQLSRNGAGGVYIRHDEVTGEHTR